MAVEGVGIVAAQELVAAWPVPVIVPLPSSLFIFSTPSIFGQPSWLVLACATPPAAA